MESVITRDTDIIREYVSALGARERSSSPFGRLAATVKLASLRRELETTRLETTDEDMDVLRRQLDDRLNRSVFRRFQANRWGARLSVVLMVLVAQQLVLLLLLLASLLFVEFAPVPTWWNPVLPHEEPIFLFAFVFFFFFTLPVLALAVLFGGRFFRSWRWTLPAILTIFVLSVTGTLLVARNKPANPVEQRTSLSQFAREGGLNVQAYQQWIDANWLMKDPKFQRDYEVYLRRGPGRWITARFDAANDAAWADGLTVIREYVDTGHDPEGFREWLRYYLDRNRIYSEDRILQEVDGITGVANQRFLAIWQVEPYLKERDQRLYQAHLGAINRSMYGWGLVSLALFAFILLTIYLTGPALSVWERMRGLVRDRVKRSNRSQFDVDPVELRESSNPSRIARWRERYYSFPERSDITTPPFFDTPFRLLSRVHRSFVRLAVFAGIFVFGLLALVYAVKLATEQENPRSQLALMRSHLLLGSPASRADAQDDLIALSGSDTVLQNFTYATAGSVSLGDLDINGLRLETLPPERRQMILAAIVRELQQQIDEAEYQNSKKLTEQDKLISSQRGEIDLLRSLTSQLQEATGALPDQISDVSSRLNETEARAGEALGELSTAKQRTDQLSSKIGDVENRVARASDQAGRVEDQTSTLATRTEALEKEFDRRAGQVEARTEELGERTAALKEREDEAARLRRIAFSAILSFLKADVDDLDRRVGSAFYRMFNKGEAERDIQSLRGRIARLATDLGEVGSEENKDLLNELTGLSNRLDEIAARVK